MEGEETVEEAETCEEGEERRRRRKKGNIEESEDRWADPPKVIQEVLADLETVPSGYPNPTRYPVFISIPDPTRFSFRNHRVAGNPKHRVLPDISGKPEVSGTTRYFGYHP